MSNSQPTKFKGVDTQLIVYYIALVVIGWLTIYSSAHDPSQTFHLFDLAQPYGRQLIWIIAAAVLAFVVLAIDTKLIQTYAYFVYAAFMLLILSVVFIGTDINGAKAWIKIGSFSIQPIEFAKFATALAIAKFFSSAKTDKERKTQWITAFILIGIPAAIALLQKDTGSALVFASFIILFYREGFNGWILLAGFFAIFLFVLTIVTNELYAVALLTVILIVAWYFTKGDKMKIIRNIAIYAGFVLFVFAVNFAYNEVLQSHQRQRIDTILGKSIDPKGADFNLNQSKIAIGSGGFFGKGYLHGTQTKLNFVPEQSTDFIFCGIGEEWGFLGCTALIALYLALIIRLIVLSEKQRNPFSRIYGYCVASIIFFHLAINIGMTIGLVPIIGIPLPFISYGGSSLWGFTALLFIFIKLDDN